MGFVRYVTQGTSTGAKSARVSKSPRRKPENRRQSRYTKLPSSDIEYEVVQIDVTESPVERPKMGRKTTIPGRKSDIH